MYQSTVRNDEGTDRSFPKKKVYNLTDIYFLPIYESSSFLLFPADRDSAIDTINFVLLARTCNILLYLKKCSPFICNEAIGGKSPAIIKVASSMVGIAIVSLPAVPLLSN
eukprot:471067_1